MFILPIGDEPELRGTPIANYVLIGLNVAAFVLLALPLMSQAADPGDPATLEYLRFVTRGQAIGDPSDLLASISAYDVFVWKWGYQPGRPSAITLLASLFLHGGFMHLAGNMLFLWIYGDNVEHRLGPISYVVVYLATGVIATLAFALVAGDSMTPLVGASGAISGVLGLYFVWFPRNVVRLLVWIFFFINVVRVPARVVIGFYLVVDNLLPLLFGARTNVAYGAHIGGLLGGFAIAYGLEWLGQRSGPFGALARKIDHRKTVQRDAGVNFTPIGNRGFRRRAEPTAIGGVDGFSLAVSRSDWRRASHLYDGFSVEERLALPDSDVMRLADALTDSGAYDEALALLRSFIASHQGSDDSARAHLRAGLIQLHFKSQPTAAAQHLYAVLDMSPSKDMEDVVRGALAQIEN